MRKSTIFMVIATAALVAAAGATVFAGDHAYAGADKCKMCHKTQHASWLTTSHAKALDTAKAATDRKFDDSCLKCHATNAKAELPGVQCEACHGAGEDYKKMTIMKDVEAAKANGLVPITQAVCDTCHTGADHATKKSLETEKENRKAMHEHKAKAK
jgi:hypothetical protein